MKDKKEHDLFYQIGYHPILQMPVHGHLYLISLFIRLCILA